jgi:phosphoglycerate kinase
MPLLDRIESFEKLDVASRRVFVRIDADVPLADGRVSDDSKLRESLPTLKHLLAAGARVIVAGHIGKQKKDSKKSSTSIEPVAAQLAALLSQDVVLADECVGDGVRKVVHDLRDGRVAMLENLRMHEGEDADDEVFARDIAKFVDVYVNDSLRASLQKSASVHTLAKVIVTRAAGACLRRELEAMDRWIDRAERPSVAVIGGGRVESKLLLLESLLGRVDEVLLGGAVANTVLVALGKKLGKSSIDPNKLAAARDWFARAKERGVDVHLPVDLVAAPATDAKEGRVSSVDGFASDAMALDVGPDTLEAYRQRLMRSKTVLWDGPMGFAENPVFFAGTAVIGRAIVDAAGYSLAVGDDTAAAAYKSGLGVRLSHVSRGGPAAIELIEGRTLPGVEALRT